jgi:hypothetical protein
MAVIGLKSMTRYMITVLQTRPNRVLIHARGEAKSALEVADGPLLSPEVRLVSLGFLLHRRRFLSCDLKHEIILWLLLA